MNVIQFLETETVQGCCDASINLAIIVMNVFGHHKVEHKTCLEAVITRLGHTCISLTCHTLMPWRPACDGFSIIVARIHPQDAQIVPDYFFRGLSEKGKTQHKMVGADRINFFKIHVITKTKCKIECQQATCASLFEHGVTISIPLVLDVYTFTLCALRNEYGYRENVPFEKQLAPEAV